MRIHWKSPDGTEGYSPDFTKIYAEKTAKVLQKAFPKWTYKVVS